MDWTVLEKYNGKWCLSIITYSKEKAEEIMENLKKDNPTKEYKIENNSNNLFNN